MEITPALAAALLNTNGSIYFKPSYGAADLTIEIADKRGTVQFIIHYKGNYDKLSYQLQAVILTGGGTTPWLFGAWAASPEAVIEQAIAKLAA